jgi:two-component system copper resistance phosphate regulon response regulator CusR
MRALVVEDDPVIADQVANLLSKQRFEVDLAYDGDEGLDKVLIHRYAVVVLDVMLPGLDGWSVCEEARKAGITTPILMLTARDAVEDRVKGLQGGADDYLPKPFDARELIARVQALLRREAVHRSGTIQIADLTIDSASHTVHRGDELVHLTQREFSLLEALARNEGRTLTREVILESVWDNEESLENTVNFHITSLRKKIDTPERAKLIHTVHGLGYVLRKP